MKLHSMDHISERLEVIQTFLESPYDAEGSILMDRLAQLDAYNAEAGKFVADANKHLADRLKSEFILKSKDLAERIMTPTLINKWVKTLAADEEYLCKWSDRVNRACVHQIESMRTQISYIKNLPK